MPLIGLLRSEFCGDRLPRMPMATPIGEETRCGTPLTVSFHTTQSPKMTLIHGLSMPAVLSSLVAAVSVSEAGEQEIASALTDWAKVSCVVQEVESEQSQRPKRAIGTPRK